MTKYHVDSIKGNDRNQGTSPEQAWKSLARAMKQRLKPGDSLLLRRGGVWTESLRIRGSGRKGKPVSIGTYGAGPRPRLVPARQPGLTNDGPVSWWHIRGLELRGKESFDPHGRKPGHMPGIAFRQSVPSQGLVIEDCVVHDFSGTGIVLSTGSSGKTIFRDWLIKDCHVYNTGTGIATHGSWPPDSFADLCHADFRITGCRVHDIATDGIVLSHCRDGVIEHCTAYRTGIGRTRRSPVGIWFYLARRCVIQFCESFDNHTAGCIADGGGFDLDGGCIDCVMQYNYSHDNDGAGYLICSYEPVKAPCIGCVTRFNISINDGRANDYPAILFWQAIDCQTYNNTCITRVSTPLKFTSNTHGHLIANNIFVVDSARDIPVVKSAYAVDSNTFRNNLYYRTGGKARFEVRAQKNMDLASFKGLVQSKGETVANPRLTALSGCAVSLRPGSPCIRNGLRVGNMGARDFSGAPAGTRGPVNIGHLSTRPR